MHSFRLAILLSSAIICLGGSLCVSANNDQSEPYTFALVGKDDLAYFTQAHRGCRSAEKELNDVRCIYRAPKYADGKEQDKLIVELINSGVDGIAVAAINSKYLSENSLLLAKSKNIPIISFDSDLDAQTLSRQPDMRLAYIGSDNVKLGETFGHQLKILFPNGATICLLSGRPDSMNMMERMQGLRAVLSGDTRTRAPGRRLQGDRGWSEHSRCPMYNYEDPDIAIRQLGYAISREAGKIQAYISLGGWAQFQPPKFESMISEHRSKIDDHNIRLMFADALFVQLGFIKSGYSAANVRQSPFEMGRKSILTLHKIVTGKHYKKLIHTPTTLCTLDNLDECKSSS